MERKTPRRLADLLRHLPSQRPINEELDSAALEKMKRLREIIASLEKELEQFNQEN